MHNTHFRIPLKTISEKSEINLINHNLNLKVYDVLS